VLGRRAGVSLGTQDVYANLAGGLTVSEPGLDLAVALALASSLRDRPIDRRTVAVGEVGLLGELRPVAGIDRRLREAARLGFDTAIVPAGRPASAPEVPGMRLVPVANLRDALEATLGAGRNAGGRADAAPAPVALTIHPERRVLG
jgi:DNA repair protein RadA/Sms